MADKNSSNRMSWDNQRDIILIGEVVMAQPFHYKKGSSERGKAWQEVGEAMQAKGFKVDKRAARDRINILIEKVKGKNKREKAASGISVEETDDEKHIREAVEELMQEEEDVEAAPKQKGDEERKKMEGSEMRKRAMETFSETQKRHCSEGNSTPRTSRSRNSGHETLELISRKLEFDQQVRREDIERKAEEEERRRSEELRRDRHFEVLQQQLLQQQQQFQQQQHQLQQQLLQQQQASQQQNQNLQTMMLAFIKSLDKKN